MVKIFYELSEVGQKSSLLAGGNGKKEQSVTVTHQQPEYSQAVALATVFNDGSASIRCDYPYYTDHSGLQIAKVLYDSPPTITLLLNDELARRERYKIKKDEKEEAERKEQEELIASILANPKLLIDDRRRRWSLNYYSLRDVPSLQECFSEADRLIEENRQAIQDEEEAEKLLKQNKQDAAKIERAKWIEDYGSDRLKRCVAEGIKHNGIYVSERMARDYPGWMLYEDHSGSTNDPINPTAEAFALLDEARLVCPDAVLQWCPVFKRYCAESTFPGDGGLINYFGKDVDIEDLVREEAEE